MTWRKRERRTLWPTIVILTALLVVVMILFRPRRPDFEPPEEPSVAVTVWRVEPSRVEDIIELPGRLEAQADVIVAVEQSGRVTEMPVHEGMLVRRGATLLRVDESLWRQRLQSARLRSRDTARDLKRIEALHRDGVLPQRDLDTAQTAAEEASIALEEIRIQLERCVPVAPFDGIVEETFVSEGEYVHAGQPVLRLIDRSAMKVRFDVPERDAQVLQAGDEVAFTCDALPGRRFSGKLQHLAVSAHPANNAFRATLLVDGADEVLRAGMLARMQFRRGVWPRALAVPLAAIVPLEGETIAYVAEQGMATRRIVRIARIVDSMAILSSGLYPDEEVIMDGNRDVLDGTPIEIQREWAPKPLPRADRQTSPGRER